MEWNRNIIILIIAIILTVVLIYMIFRKPSKETFTKREEKQKDDEYSLFLFYGEQCGHCKKMKPEWERLKSILPPNIRTYEMESSDPNMGAYNIEGVPTIRFYKGEPLPTNNGINYTGNRTAEEILKFVETIIKNK